MTDRMAEEFLRQGEELMRLRAAAERVVDEHCALDGARGERDTMQAIARVGAAIIALGDSLKEQP